MNFVVSFISLYLLVGVPAAFQAARWFLALGREPGVSLWANGVACAVYFALGWIGWPVVYYGQW